MAFDATKPLVHSCCRCCTLRTGTLTCAVVAIIMSIITIIIMFTTHVEFRTIIIDTLPQWIVKIILAVNLAMTILISVLLIVGVYKRNWFLMLPWVILGFLLIIGLVISVIVTAVRFFINGDSVMGTLFLIIGFIGTVIYTYMWIVVYSFFNIVREEDKRGLYIKAPFRRA